MAEEQNVTIKVCDRPYMMKATSPEMEEILRKAADLVNRKIKLLKQSYPGKTELDILTFVALNECVSELGLRKKCSDTEAALKSLNADIETYLDDMEKSSR